jgi:hypothetical protein
MTDIFNDVFPADQDALATHIFLALIVDPAARVATHVALLIMLERVPDRVRTMILSETMLLIMQDAALYAAICKLSSKCPPLLFFLSLQLRSFPLLTTIMC